MSVENLLFNKIKRAVTYIEVELNNDNIPSLTDIASHAAISPFHFHRLFKLVTGETCAEQIRRLRLAKGAASLQNPATSITQAAMAAGYSSSQAFAKVIKRELSASATEFRADPVRLATTLRRLSLPMGDVSKSQIIVEICELEPLSIMMVRTVDKYPDLIETYGALYEAAGGPEKVRAAFGLPHRDIETWSEDGFVFDAAIWPSAPPAQGSVLIDGSKYLAIRHKGLDADQPKTLDVLYRAAMALDGAEMCDAPPIFHFIDDPEEVLEAECRTDIYLPILLGFEA